MVIAVDFDGTIVEHDYPKIGKEIPFAIETLKRLQENGHKIVLWSVREEKYLNEAVEYCRRRGLDFYAVNSEYPGASWSGSGVSRKLTADIYIDDRNVGGIPDWSTIYDMITCHHSYSDIIAKAVNDGMPSDFEIYSGTFHHHHRRTHKHRRSLLRRFIDRCRSARAKFER